MALDDEDDVVAVVPAEADAKGAAAAEDVIAP